jgi:hypothetical protein
LSAPKALVPDSRSSRPATSLDELADAVAGDIGFIVDSAVDARNASLIAVPGGRTGPAIFPKLARKSCRGSG